MSSTDTSWTFVTNHTRTLLVIAANPQIRVRDIAQQIGITERAAQRIVADLTNADYLKRERVGRRNHYTVNRARPLRHQAERGHEVGDLLEALALDADRQRDQQAAGA